MEYRKLGSSGLKVSSVGLGTNNFGGRMDEASSIEVIQSAIDQGINMFDTANIYGANLSEVYIGKAVKGQRDKVLLATKVSGKMGDGPNDSGTSRLHIMYEVEQSLSRLDTDYIDLYQIHFPSDETSIEETLRALDDLVTQGKVRYIGCSNYASWQACEAIWTSRTLGLNSFVSVQPHYNLLTRSIERELMPFCQAYDVGIIPFFPLASGFLTGKYRPGSPAPEGTRLAGPMGERTLTDANFESLDQLETFAKDHGHSLLELAFSWLLAKPKVATVIAGATSPQQVQSNIEATAWSLSAKEVEEVDQITKKSLAR
jgi:aryl-alcohol dehydrogenase-like predicted oxidoreductase